MNSIDLPVEILHIIVRYLDAVTVCIFRRVSKDCKGLVDAAIPHKLPHGIIGILSNDDRYVNILFFDNGKLIREHIIHDECFGEICCKSNETLTVHDHYNILTFKNRQLIDFKKYNINKINSYREVIPCIRICKDLQDKTSVVCIKDLGVPIYSITSYTTTCHLKLSNYTSSVSTAAYWPGIPALFANKKDICRVEAIIPGEDPISIPVNLDQYLQTPYVGKLNICR